MTRRVVLRGLARLAFWLLTASAAATVASFLWAALPVVVARVQGGSAALWLFGDTGLVVAAAWAWLAAAGALMWRRRALRRRPPA